MTELARRIELRAIAASGIRGRADTRVIVERDDENALLEGISRERLTGLAAGMAERGTLELSTGAHDELSDRHEEQLALDLRLERALIDAASTLAAAGIPYRALKGPVLAHTVYGDPALRSFGDIDLLVPGECFDDAAAALRGLGFDRRFIEPRSGFDARFAKGACLERDDGVELDMHRTFAPGAFGVRLAHAELFARPARTFELGGRTIAGLDRELAFVHACFHAALGDNPARLVPVRDVVEISSIGFDECAVIELAASVRCGSVFQRAVALVRDELGIRLDGRFSEWTSSYRTTRFDRWALHGYVGEGRSYAGQVVASLAAMRSVRERASYAAALAFPSRDYLRARERTYASRLTRGMQIVGDARPR